FARSQPHSSRKVGCCVPAASRTWRRVNHTTVEWLAENRTRPPLRVAARRRTHADDCIHHKRRPIHRGGEEFGGTRNFRLTRRLLCHDSRRTIGLSPGRTGSCRLCLLHRTGRNRSIARCSRQTMSKTMPMPTTIALHELVGRNSVEPAQLL